jgi:glycosyltransferase involved in cell wall biosynthesis
MKLAALVNGLEHPSYRYRLRAFESALRDHGWEVVARDISRGWLSALSLLGAVRSVDAVFLQRRLLSREKLFILRRCARRLIYDFDDAVFYRSSNSPKGPHSRRRKSRFVATVRAADAVIAGNGFLADFARQYAAEKKVHTIPTCVDPARYERAGSGDARMGTELVWIGSASTLKTIVRVPRHFEAISRLVPQARLNIVCDVFPESLPIAVTRCPWSMETEAQALGAADIGISWMPDDAWSRGKCGLKVLQYMAAGLPVIANPVGVHREMVSPGKTGFLVDAPEEWAQAVGTLARDSNLRYSMGSAGRAKVVRDCTPARWASEFIRVISGHTEPSGD